jgi:hypothetical protein
MAVAVVGGAVAAGNKAATGVADPAGEPLSFEPMADQDPQEQLQAARQDAELTLEQLHMVQEELEHYFLAHQEAEALLQRYRQQQQRAESLIEALLARLEARGG